MIALAEQHVGRPAAPVQANRYRWGGIQRGERHRKVDVFPHDRAYQLCTGPRGRRPLDCPMDGQQALIHILRHRSGAYATASLRQSAINDFATVTSLFSALFVYAKDSRFGAAENFTTEALAGAIRMNPEPFMSWLTDEGVLPARSKYHDVETQRYEKEGILDLVLHTSTPDKPHRLIVEVKVDAGQSGDQLRRYGQVVERWICEGYDCPRTVILSREPIDKDHTHLSWHSLRRQLARSSNADGLWPAFAAYLTERKLSDSHDDPMTLTEAESLVPSSQLLDKMTRILHELLDDLRKGPSQLQQFAAWFPKSERGSRQSVRSRIDFQFTRHRRAVIYPKLNGQMPMLMVFIGIWEPPHESETRIGVWLETAPREDRLRKDVANEASRVGLTALGWQEDRTPGAWPILSSWEPLIGLASPEGAVSHENARAAFRRRLDELLDSGMLDYVLRNWHDRQAPAMDEEAE